MFQKSAKRRIDRVKKSQVRKVASLLAQPLRGKSGKKPGGQKGHPGTTLSLIKDPQHVVVHRPEACEGCGGSLFSRDGTSEVPGYERRQVADLPALLALE